LSTSTNPDIHHRRIDLTTARREQIAMAAAYLGISGQRFISCAIYCALAACRKAAQPDMAQDNTSEAGLTAEAIPA
jgi:hypothetical protein